MNTTAIILSGGKSSRMGENKALLPFWGKTTIEHVLRSMLKLTDKILVSANTEQYNFLNQRIVSDIFTDKGPLAGLHASLKACNTELAFVATCDAPLVSSELYFYLLQKYEKGVDAVVAVHKGKVHPLVGIYNKSLTAAIEKTVLENKLSVMKFLDKHNVRYIEIDASLPFYFEHQFLNLNTPEEYEKLQLMEAGIKVLYFGITGDISGKPEEFFTEINNVAELKNRLFINYPELKKQVFKVSVNQVLANDNFRLHEGDEIALLPPFAGG